MGSKKFVKKETAKKENSYKFKNMASRSSKTMQQLKKYAPWKEETAVAENAAHIRFAKRDFLDYIFEEQRK